MSDLQQLQAKAVQAEQQLAQVQAQLQQLKNQLIPNGKVPSEDSKEEKIIKTEKKKDKKKPEEKIDLPFKLIENEAVLISEKGKDATMRVTICNGESNPPFISAKGINWLKNNFITNEKDIFVDTYAKCGTTLCIKLVYQIYKSIGKICDGASAEDMSDPWNAVPWIEVDVSQELVNNNNNKPNKFIKYINESNNRKNNIRIWKSHAPWVNFPAKNINNNSKIIHVTRNPKDVVCSYFNFFQKEPFVEYKGDFNTLFEWFCDGSVVHSNFWDFELAWYRASQKNDKQILWITFEEIVRIPHVAIKKVANFLNVELNDNQINNVCFLSLIYVIMLRVSFYFIISLFCNYNCARINKSVFATLDRLLKKYHLIK